MKLAFFSVTLNHHQAGVADALYAALGDEYCFVELSPTHDAKGALTDFSTRPYLIKAWESPEAYSKAMTIATTAEACVFSGAESIPFEIPRLKRNLLSFDMGERLLKKGLLNLASPRIMKMVAGYYINNWRSKKFFKLCCSAYTAPDCKKLGMFRGKCYKWGYFPEIDEETSPCDILENKQASGVISLMWCARFLTLKHPELAVELAHRLDVLGHNFVMDIYGDECSPARHEVIFQRAELIRMINDYNLEDKVILHGSRPNSEILKAMREHDIFLFTSDRLEGWGAVANEALSSGCVVVASDQIGSIPYLIQDGSNGLIYEGTDIDSLTDKARELFDSPYRLKKMQVKAIELIREKWSPRQAARRLLELIEHLQYCEDTPFETGPCSKA